MNLHPKYVQEFAGELEKTARAAPLAGAVIGGAAAGLWGQAAFDRQDQEDRVRRHTGMLSPREFKKRRQSRSVKRLISTAAGIGAGALTPYGYRMAVGRTAKAVRSVAKPTLAEWKKANEDFLQHQADYILTEMQHKGRGIGKTVGTGVREGIEADTPTRLRVEHGITPATRDFLFPGWGKKSKSPVIRAASRMRKQSSAAFIAELEKISMARLVHTPRGHFASRLVQRGKLSTSDALKFEKRVAEAVREAGGPQFPLGRSSYRIPVQVGDDFRGNIVLEKHPSGGHKLSTFTGPKMYNEGTRELHESALSKEVRKALKKQVGKAKKDVAWG